MGLMDYLKTQFLEIIQWEDDSRDTISFRYPDMDKEIKRGAQLIVRESQIAQLIYLGQFGDTFGPGKWTLTTDNIPILSTLKGWKYGLEISSFIVENVSVPSEVEQAIDKRSSMAAVGNLNEYVKFQMAEGMAKSEGGGAAGSAAQLGAGLALGQQVAQSFAASQSA